MTRLDRKPAMPKANGRRSLIPLGFLVLLAVACGSVAVAATNQDDLVGALKIKYPITETTPDRSQITQAGIVMRIVKDGISAQPWDTLITFDNPIADGAVQHHSRWVELAQSTQARLGQTRNLMVLKPGDTVYITRIESKTESKDDLLKIAILTCDALDVDDGASQKRYAATISFKMPKNSLMESGPDQVEQAMEVVLAPYASDARNNSTAASTKPRPAAPRPAQPALTKAALTTAPVSKAAPAQAAPAPATATQNIALGQTIQQVVAIMGQPKQIVDLGAKKVYTYQDLKIVFVNGKVNTVE
jgi:hypothetical protein